MVKRLLSLLLAFMLVFVSACSLADASSPETVTVTFNSIVTKSNQTVDFAFDWDWFDAPHESYQHKIAQASLIMAMAAFRTTSQKGQRGDVNLDAFFSSCGFTGYSSCEYDVVPTIDTIATGIASKTLQDEQGDYDLVAVAVCGQGYGDEWLSNFTVNNGIDHEGFLSAAEQVAKRVNDYVAANCAGRRVKIWATGFSRAAAVSNLLGDLLLSSGLYENTNIFVYSYGTPNTTRLPVDYPQIYSICGSFDPVPRVPLANWGYEKHGTVLYLPARENTLNYDELTAAAENVFGSLLGSTEQFPALVRRNWLISTVLRLMASYLTESHLYSGYVQDAVIAAWRHKGPMVEKAQILLDKLNESGALDIVGEHGSTTFGDEVRQMLQILVYDSASEITGTGSGETGWVDILSSGMLVCHEHYPEVYLSWMLSTEDPDLLFNHPTEHIELYCSGDMKVNVYDEDGNNIPLLSAKNPSGKLACFRIGDMVCIDLPGEHEYTVLMTASAKTQVQLGISHVATKRITDDILACSPMELDAGDSVIMKIPADSSEAPYVQLSDGLPVLMVDSAAQHSSSRALLTASYSTRYTDLSDSITSMVVMIPFLVSGALTLLFLIIACIIRLIRKRKPDEVSGTMTGRILLYVGFVLAVAGSVQNIIQMIVLSTRYANAAVSNASMLKVAGLLGWGSRAYTLCAILMYGMMAALAFRSVHHKRSRHRLLILSLQFIILNTIRLIACYYLGFFRLIDLTVQLAPLVCLIALPVVHVTTEEERRRLMPRIRCFYWTVLLMIIPFAIRIVLLRSLPETAPICVILKCLTGLPVIGLSTFLFSRKKDTEHLLVVCGASCHWIGDSMINLSFTLGMLCHGLGHACFCAVCLLRCRPKLRQLAAGGVLFLLLLGLLIPLRGNLPTTVFVPAIGFALLMSAMAASASRAGHRMHTGALLLVLSDLVVVFRLIHPGILLLDAISLMLYYSALLVLVLDPKALHPEEPAAPAEEPAALEE